MGSYEVLVIAIILLLLLGVKMLPALWLGLRSGWREYLRELRDLLDTIAEQARRKKWPRVDNPFLAAFTFALGVLCLLLLLK